MEPPSLQLLDRVAVVDESRELPLHAQVRRALRDLIERHFQDGQKFFTEPELIARLHVSQGTLRRALLDLSRQGLLERRVAKGSFVRKPTAAPHTIATLGIVVSAWDSAFRLVLLEQFARICQDADVRMEIYYTHKDESAADVYRWVGSATQDKAIVLLGSAGGEATPLYDVLDQRGYRVVVVDAPLPERNARFVGTDNHLGIRLGLEHLLALGHRRVLLLVNEPASEPAVAQRREAFQTVMKQRGLAAPVIDCQIHSWDDSFEAAYRNMDRVLASGCTAVLAVSDPGAWAVLKWCAERGIAVPGALSVLGFDDERPSRFTQPALSTIAQPMASIAQAAFQMLWDQPSSNRYQLLPPTLVVRQSTAPPAQGSPALSVTSSSPLGGS